MSGMRRLAVILVVLLTIAITGGCTSSAPAKAPKTSATPAPGTTGIPAPPADANLPTTLAGYYAQRLAWKPCEAHFECAWLTVPVNYARPAGKRFELPVVKLPAADPARRIGALVINPGGPGGSGVEYALDARSGEFTQAVLDRFDIVGFDPRGVGDSIPALRCMSGPELDKYFETGSFPISAPQGPVVAESKLYAGQCATNAAALLPYVGTVNSAKDMDILRAALGESKLTYLGKSYGTFLGSS